MGQHRLERDSGSKRLRFEFRVAPLTLPLPQEWNGPSRILIFVRYDEGKRNVVQENLLEHLSEKKATQNP